MRFTSRTILAAVIRGPESILYVNVRLTQVAHSERLVGRVDRIQVAGWTRMNRMSHRRCLPEAVGRPPAKAFSNTSRSSLSSTFMRIQFGRGRLLKPAT